MCGSPSPQNPVCFYGHDPRNSYERREESNGQSDMVSLMPFPVGPLSSLAVSPVLLGFDIGTPNGTNYLSSDEWLFASLQPPLAGSLYTCLPFLPPSVEPTASSGWPGWLGFSWNIPTHIQKGFWFKKRQLVNRRAFRCVNQETQ